MSDTSNEQRIADFLAKQYPPQDMTGTDAEFPFIGYLDADGNILEEGVARDIVDALDDGAGKLTLADVYTKVATEDFWQEEIDDQDENTEQPRYRIL